MLSGMISYQFLVLSLLLGIPSWIFFIWRPDLRRMAGWLALLSLPFALTERFFYPEYWEPRFLGPFIHMVGFGIEDLLFVVHLSWIAGLGYWVIAGKALSPSLPIPSNRKKISGRMGLLFLLVFGGFGSVLALQWNVIYAALMGMSLGMAWMVYKRRDLLVADLGGMLITGLTYFFVLFLYGLIYPKDFTQIWRTTTLSNRFVFGVPLEEILYGLICGGLATIIYPYLFDARITEKRVKA